MFSLATTPASPADSQIPLIIIHPIYPIHAIQIRPIP
jgi:hypothetical protein